jgi:hypothetical protein
MVRRKKSKVKRQKAKVEDGSPRVFRRRRRTVAVFAFTFAFCLFTFDFGGAANVLCSQADAFIMSRTLARGHRVSVAVRQKKH